MIYGFRMADSTRLHQSWIYLLKCKDMLIEIKLDLFISNIYAQLFKGISCEVLKSEYV